MNLKVICEVVSQEKGMEKKLLKMLCAEDDTDDDNNDMTIAVWSIGQ